MGSGAPTKLRLTPDRSTINSNHNNLSFVTVKVVDKDGNLVSDAAIPVRFEISGAGERGAVGSGNPNLPESFQQPKRTIFEGRCPAIVRPIGKSGKVILRAEAEGLTSARRATERGKSVMQPAHSNHETKQIVRGVRDTHRGHGRISAGLRRHGDFRRRAVH
jgi:hypothetical protein